MGPEYRFGTVVVIALVILAAALSFSLLGTTQQATRAGQSLGDGSFPLGTFSLTERSGRSITETDFRDQVSVVSFIFTRCPLSCPRITSVMKILQDKLANSSVQLVSISVDPTFDTPNVLRNYADKFGADPSRWWFLTGAKDLIYDLIEKRFKLSVADATTEANKDGSEAILHSDRLALVVRGYVVGLFDSNDPAAIHDLIEQASRRSRPAWVTRLPAVNASLNGLCALLLLAGWFLIRKSPSSSTAGDPLLRENVQQHRLYMLAAVVASSIFLGSYLVYHYLAGSVSFRGQGLLRSLYFTILISHTILATFGVVPLVSMSLFRALKGDFVRHARIAKITFPIWLYVSITGVIIYLMLYQLPLSWTTFVVAG